MNIYKKLYFSMLAFFCTQHSNSLAIDPIEIRSSINDLLYAEIKFTQAQPNSRLKVSLANQQDLDSMDVKHKRPDQLNFFIRYHNNNTGIITITSTYPVTNPELNMVLKIEEGHNIRLQHIQLNLTQDTNRAHFASILLSPEQPLSPLIIKNENDISIHSQTYIHVNNSSNHLPNLFKTNVFQQNFKQDQPLIISKSLPPTLNKITPQSAMAMTLLSSSVINNLPLPNQQPDEQRLIISKTLPPLLNTAYSQVNLYKTSAVIEKQLSQSKPINHQISTHLPRTYIVKKNESLWDIAKQFSIQGNKFTSQMMQKIYIHNRNAFVQGNINKIKQGSILNLTMLSPVLEDGSQLSAEQKIEKQLNKNSDI
jgi:pilus assembly protein FimV